MYEAFYGLKEKPFSMLPDPGFLYLSKKHQTALTLLEYGLYNKVGFCVISGEPGAGKTTILRAMLERVSDDVNVGLITNTHQSFGGLLDWILSVYDLHKPDLTKVEMHQIFMEYLIEEYAKNRSVLLIVDEAQNMNADSLEELRMLSNVNTEKDQLLQVVLVGQPALKDLLRQPELMQFAQRIAVDYHLAPLNLEETCGYIQHRLVIAGAKNNVFTPAACERIFNYSGGTPRLINLLCETVLVFGFADQLEMIDADLVEEMIHERMADSVVPIVNKDTPSKLDDEAIEKLEENFPWITQSDEQVDDPEEQEKDVSVSGNVAEQPNGVADGNTTNAESDAISDENNDVENKVKQAEGSSSLENGMPASSQAGDNASAITGESIRPAAIPAGSTTDKAGITISPQQIKVGVFAVVLIVVLVILAVVLIKDNSMSSGVADNALSEQQKIEAAEKKIAKEIRTRQAEEKLAIEVAAAKEKYEKELAEQEKIKKDKIKKEQAALATKEKKAKEKKAREEKAKKKRAEEKRIAREKEKEQKARDKKSAEEREKRKAAKLEEERKRLEAEAAAQEIERERLEADRAALAASAEKLQKSSEIQNQNNKSAAGEGASDGWVEGKSVSKDSNKKSKTAGCSGPTARFKSHCR